MQRATVVVNRSYYTNCVLDACMPSAIEDCAMTFMPCCPYVRLE